MRNEVTITVDPTLSTLETSMIERLLSPLANALVEALRPELDSLRQQVEHANSEAACNEEVPIGPAEPINIETSRSHGPDHGIRSPLWIRAAKSKRVSDREKHEQPGSNSIEQGRSHRFSFQRRLDQPYRQMGFS